MMPVVVVFDLDDTLYKEIDYLKSAFHYIAALVAREEGGEPVGIYERMVCNFYQGLNVFHLLIDSDAPGFSMDRLMKEYRTHRPQISLDVDTKLTLSVLRQHEVVMGVVTDGRSIQQRNKIMALGLERFILPHHILISEEQGYGKPDKRLFYHFMEMHPDAAYYYVGDNPAKDFIAPNQLGWTTVCLLDDGRNIHTQDENVPTDYQAQYTISRITDLLDILHLPSGIC